MRQVTFMVFLALISMAYSSSKEGVNEEFNLKSTDIQAFEFSISNPHVVLYFQPSMKNEDLQEKLVRKHKAIKKDTKSTKEDDDDDDIEDDGDRILSQKDEVKTKSLGKIKVYLSDEKNIKKNAIEIENYYSTAYFKNAIDKKKLTRVTIVCIQGPCQGSITAYSQGNDPEIKADQEQLISISKSRPFKVFSLTLPDKTKADRVVIVIRPKSESLAHDHVELDVFGDVDAKIHRQGGIMYLAIDSQSKTSCNGCIIDVVISASNPLTKSKLSVAYTAYATETTLQQDVPRIDYLQDLGSQNLYKIKLSDKFEVFKLRVASFMGAIPKMIANLDKRPEEDDDYQFSSIISGDVKGGQVSILFRNQELNGGQYLYVMLKDISGVYEIEFSKSREDPVVLINELYISQLKPGKVHTYMMRAFPAPQSNGLYAKIGAYHIGKHKGDPSFKLYLKQCTKQFCVDEQFSTDPMAIAKVDQYESQVQMIEEKDGISYKMSPQCQSSEQDKDGYCWYGLAVLSTDPLNNLNYMLTSTIAKGNIIISPNQPYSSEILEGDIHPLIFFYEKTKGDIAIMFSISSPNVDFLISSNPKCNPVTVSCAKFSGGQDSLVTLRGTDMKEGAYYISLEGLVTSQYSFTVYVQNKKNANQVILEEGQSHRGELHPGKLNGDISYFQFVVDFDKKVTGEVASDTTRPDIQINLLGAKYKLAMTLNLGEQLPSVEEFDLISLKGFLSIQHSDKQNYLRKGTYSVAVEFLNHDSLEEIDESTVIPFTITFTTSRTLKSLNLNQAHYDTILPKRTNTYFFIYDQQKIKRRLLISKQHLAPDDAEVKIFLGSEPQRVEKGDSGFELSLKDYHSSTYEIEQKVFNKLCGESTDNSSIVNDSSVQTSQVCEIFIFVQNLSPQKIQYSLTVWNPDSPIQLHEGHSQQYNLDSIEAGQFLLFTYTPVSYTNEVQMIIQSFYGQLSYKLLLMQRTDDIEVDIKELDRFQAAPHNTHSKTLAVSAFKECQPDCELHIQVFPEFQNIANVKDQQKPRNIDIDDTFSIVVSQKFLEITSGQHIEITVSHNSPRYFIFNDVRGLVSDTDNKLIIMLQEFVGRGAMCIALSDDEFLRVPFISEQSSCDFTAIGNRLELESSSIVAQMTSAGLFMRNNPVLIIEVSSFVDVSNTKAAGKFELVIEKSMDEEKQVMLATPYKVQLGEGENSTLAYFNYLAEDIEIKVTRLSGFGWLSVTYCLDDNNEQCEMVDVVGIQNQFLTGQSQTNFAISTQSKSFCVFCTYLFNFSTEKLISLLALVTVTTSSQFVRLSQGVTFLDYLGPKDLVNIYRVPFDTQHQTEVTIKVYEGSPELWLGTWPSLEVKKYQYGPFTAEKFREQLNLTEDGQGFFEAILPPRQHLLDNQDEYNISTLGVNPNHTLAAHFVEDDLYLLVRSTKKSAGTNYSVLISQGTNGAGNSLEDGLLTKTVLSRMKPTASFFYYHLSDNQPLLIVKVVNNIVASLHMQNLIQVTAFVSPSTDHTTANLSNMVEVELKIFQTHTDQIAYRLPNITGFYDIKVTNLMASNQTTVHRDQVGFNKEGSMNIAGLPLYFFGHNYLDMITLDVAINSQDMFLLETNTWMQGIIKPQQDNYYEMYISKKGQLAVSLQNCNGDLKLSYTQNYKKFMKEDFESSIKSANGFTLDTIIAAKVGPLYLAVHSDSQSDAIYNIQTSNSLDGNPLPHGKLLLGGDGQIQWNIHQEDPDKIDISFKPLKCLQCNEDTESKSEIKYEIVWSTQELYLNTLGKCGAMQFMEEAKANNNIYGELVSDIVTLEARELQTHVIDVAYQSDSSQVYLSVRAKVIMFAGEPVSNYVLLYQNIQVGLPKNVIYLFKHKRQEFTLYIGVLIVFVLMMYLIIQYRQNRLCGICYIYKRLRSLKKVTIELELERKMNKAIQNKNLGQQEKYGELEEEQNPDQNPEQNL